VTGHNQGSRHRHLFDMTLRTTILLLSLLLPAAGLADAAGATAAGASRKVDTPYGVSEITMDWRQVPGAPVYYVIGRSAVPDAGNEGFTANAGFVVTDDGVVVYDTLGTPALGYRMLLKIREVTDRPVKVVVAGHYHADHIYGLQAFREHTEAGILAHETAHDYFHSRTFLGGTEDAGRRLAQRRAALSAWVDEDTYIVPPDATFSGHHSFRLGGYRFELIPRGPAHSPSDTVMIVHGAGVIFSGDLIYTGRVPFLDNPAVDTANWLAGLAFLESLEPAPEFVIPGHGRAFADPAAGVAFTRGYIEYLRDAMGEAARQFVDFDSAYARTDWSAYRDLPAFAETNRGNAFMVYLEMEAAMLAGE
jgi:glyoxylase-like metal-dependent hydrolase (beta-lactamase superfamily II)